MYHFDPQGQSLDERPSFKFITDTLSSSAKITFKIRRFTTLSTPPTALPYQLFGAMYGIHSAVDATKYPNFRPAASPLVTEDIVENLRSAYSAFLTPMGTAANIAAINGIATGAASLASKDKIFDVGYVTRWQPDGSLLIGRPVIDGADTEDYVIISCQEISYRSFLKALEDAVVKIDRVRLTYQSLDTIAEIWNLEGKTMFGATDGNDLSVADYFEPNQQQANVLDVTQSLIIDGESALNSIMPAAESLITYTCSVTEVINNNLRSE